MPQIINGRKIYDPTNEADMREAEEISKRQIAAMEAREKPLNVKVTVDSEQMKNLLAQQNKLEAELENAKRQVQESAKNGQLFDTMKNTIAEKYQREGLEVPNVESVEDLQNAEKNLKAFQQKGNFGTAQGGSAQLNAAQLGISEQKQVFGSQKEMIDQLMQRKRDGDQQAAAVIDRLSEKVFFGLKNNRNQQFSTPEQPKGETKPFNGFQLGEGTIAEYLRASRPKRAIEAERQLRGN